MVSQVRELATDVVNTYRSYAQTSVEAEGLAFTHYESMPLVLRGGLQSERIATRRVAATIATASELALFSAVVIADNVLPEVDQKRNPMTIPGLVLATGVAALAIAKCRSSK
jgi:hypothetical protein